MKQHPLLVSIIIMALLSGSCFLFEGGNAPYSLNVTVYGNQTDMDKTHFLLTTDPASIFFGHPVINTTVISGSTLPLSNGSYTLQFNDISRPYSRERNQPAEIWLLAAYDNDGSQDFNDGDYYIPAINVTNFDNQDEVRISSLVVDSTKMLNTQSDVIKVDLLITSLPSNDISVTQPVIFALGDTPDLNSSSQFNTIQITSERQLLRLQMYLADSASYYYTFYHDTNNNATLDSGEDYIHPYSLAAELPATGNDITRNEGF